MQTRTDRRPLLVSKSWAQAAIVVFVVGFFILGLLAYRTYAAQPPIPERVEVSSGELLFTASDIRSGQQAFLRAGLMEYGSVFGHGGYLGPDFTADYLRRAALEVRRRYSADGLGDAQGRTIADFKDNRYDVRTGTLRLTAAQGEAFKAAEAHYRELFNDPTTRRGLRPSVLDTSGDVHRVTAFFAWTAWAASARRPGKDYSYTNDWPPEPLVDNRPTAQAIIWSVLSLAALLGGIGILFAAYGRWEHRLGWQPRERQLSFRAPADVALTPAQRACAWFFLATAALFLVQAIVGGATQHYRAELSGFFGVDLARHFPFNLARTWHVQLAILWVATSYLGAGIFLAPMIGRHEPRGQHWLAYALLAALCIVVVGSLAGEAATIHGLTRDTFFGGQGFEYLDLGRFWQILLSLGLVAWVALLWRALAPRLRTEHLGNMPWLFFFSALAIPAFYAVGLLARSDATFTTTDFWRFWVVHLWVEDFLELFTTIMVAYAFVLLGVVAERTALAVIYLDIVLYSVGGVVGTMHHLYFSGEPAEHMALGAFFSAAEVIPLTFLTVEAWTFLSIGTAQVARRRDPFPHRYAILFLVAVGFWNFLGAGIFGFLINLPIVSYYEIGTALTANHGHAAMMGVYGMLAVGLALFGLRYLIPPERWSERLAKASFWSMNIGLAWMVFATLFPLGVLQLYEAVNRGYFEARELKFLTSPTNALLEWLRLPGDVVFIVGGVVPFAMLCWRGVRYRVSRVASKPTDVLFLQPESTGAARED